MKRPAFLSRRLPCAQTLALGPLRIRRPLLLCGWFYFLLCKDGNGFVRLGLAAAVLHECGHILVWLLLFGHMPPVFVSAAGLCMATGAQKLSPGRRATLAAAGPAANLLAAALFYPLWARRATVRGAAFLSANLLTAAFNLLPVPPLDGAQLLAALWGVHSAKNKNCKSGWNRVQ